MFDEYLRAAQEKDNTTVLDETENDRLVVSSITIPYPKKNKIYMTSGCVVLAYQYRLISKPLVAVYIIISLPPY